MRALIADDNRIETAILSKSLQRLNIDVTVVHDGAAAWEKLAGMTVPLWRFSTG